jgi:chromosome partitioning protein
MSRIVTVAARKGGVGKTTLAYELGGGYRHEERMRVPASRRHRVPPSPPRLLTGYHKPDLVPSSN